MKHPAIKTRFELDNAAGTLTDISTWLTNITPSSDSDKIDVTTFQPDAVGPALKDERFGFSNKGYSLAGMWSEDVEEFFSGIEGESDLEYRYKPDDPNMHSSITGICSCGSYSGPISDVSGYETFTAELTVQSRVFNRGSAGSPSEGSPT